MKSEKGKTSLRQKAIDSVTSIQKNSVKTGLNKLSNEDIENEIKATRATEEWLKLAGSWEDDRTAEEIIADIKKLRTEIHKEPIFSLDEYNSIMGNMDILSSKKNADRLFESVEQMNSGQKVEKDPEDLK